MWFILLAEVTLLCYHDSFPFNTSARITTVLHHVEFSTGLDSYCQFLLLSFAFSPGTWWVPQWQWWQIYHSKSSVMFRTVGPCFQVKVRETGVSFLSSNSWFCWSKQWIWQQQIWSVVAGYHVSGFQHFKNRGLKSELDSLHDIILEKKPVICDWKLGGRKAAEWTFHFRLLRRVREQVSLRIPSIYASPRRLY